MEETRMERQSKETQNTEEKEGFFFHLIESAGENAQAPAEQTETSSSETQKMQALLGNISAEVAQLNEYLMEESKLIHELCTSIKHILKKLHVSVNIPPESITIQETVKSIVLDEEGRLKITDENGKEHAAFLAEYSPEVIMAVLWNIIPELADALRMYRKKIIARVNFLVKLKDELTGIVKTLVQIEEQSSEFGESSKIAD